MSGMDCGSFHLFFEESAIDSVPQKIGKMFGQSVEVLIITIMIAGHIVSVLLGTKVLSEEQKTEQLVFRIQIDGKHPLV